MDPSELAVLPGRLVSERFLWDVAVAETSRESWVVLTLIAWWGRVNLPSTCLHAMLKGAARDAGNTRPVSVF